ncbi:MAG: hypothetical protein HOV77_34035 [Hamadaea sp.]|uniref:hypothetical protein n=1 Tax=Hamadaea sp. TaxID=2024425 RepID=UPI0017D66DC4|nr:hypothetical protein [Hamadaea sp.]NUT24202.1 hypothetical protein [Hamadaea sp.]
MTSSDQVRVPRPRTSSEALHVYDHSKYAALKGWTDEQFRMVRQITEVLSGHEWATAGFLVGSLARGTCDRFSDVDYHVLADPRADWRPLVEAIAPGAFVGAFGRAHEPGFLPGAFGLLPNGLKFDVFIHDPNDFDLASLSDHLPLFDTQASRFTGIPTTSSPGYRVVGPYFVPHAANSFYFAMEALVQLLCRSEIYLVFRNNGVRLDTAWIPLFLAENGIEKFDGKRRISACLHSDQLDILSQLISLPYGDIPSLLERIQWEQAEFSQRGRKLAADTGATWPDELERIVVNKFLAHMSELL